MKKSVLLWSMIGIIAISLLATIIFMIYNPLNNEKLRNKGINYRELGKYLSIDGLPEEYSFEQALYDGCFIITDKQVYNAEILDEFIENTKITNKNRTSDILRIIEYTKEGDMLITDICYQRYQNKYVVVTDNSKDRFVEKSNKKSTIKNDLPGNFYGITKTESEDYIKLELTVYGEETSEYKNYEIASYLKTAKINETGPNFIGTVEKVNGKAVFVKTDDKSGEFECDKYSFIIPEKQQIQLKKGDKVLVIYTGVVTTTYPAKIDLVEIKKVEENL